MTATVTALFRYPIKSVGSEAVEAVTLSEGQTMPWDRTWAILHAHSKTNGAEWARCMNFLRVASSPALAAVRAVLNEDTETLTLTHPDCADLTVHPERAAKKLVEWLAPLVAEGRAKPTGVARAPGRGMTDTASPSVSIANMASHRAVSQKVGHDLSLLRWRSNIWVDGLAPWEEFEWDGKTLQIGEVAFDIEAPIGRCQNVLASPKTGRRDLDVLGALDSWGHQDFSMAGIVTKGGRIRLGDTLSLL